MAIFGSLRSGRGGAQPLSGGAPDQIDALRDELVDRATRHEILAAQRTDLVVDQLWRRLEAADARLATALQKLEERVSVLEQKRPSDTIPPQQPESLLPNG